MANLRRRTWWSIGTLIVYSGLSFLIFRATWAVPTTHLIGGCCDSPAPAWFLEWTSYALTHLGNPLITHLAGVPNAVNIMWQPPAMPFLGVVMTPVELLLGPFISYDLVVTLALSLSGWACYTALRRWVGGFVAPFVGGLVFGFSPFMAAQSLGHPQFTFAPLVPLFFLVLSDLLVYRKWPTWVAGLGLGVIAAAEYMISQEIFGELMIGGLVAVLILAAVDHRQVRSRVGEVGRGLGFAALTSMALLAWPLSVEFTGPGILHGLLRPQNAFVTDLANLVVPNPVVSQLPLGISSDAFRWGWDIGELGVYVGLPLLVILTVFVVMGWRERIVRVASIWALCMLVLSLGPSLHVAGRDINIWLPWAAVERLPLLENALPVRFDLFWQLGVATLVAIAARSIAHFAAGRARLASGLVLAGALVLMLPTLTYQTWVPTVPSLFTTSAVDQIPSGARVFIAPFPRDQLYDAAPMLWQADAGLRFSMPGGYIFLPAQSGQGLAPTGGTPDALTGRLDAIGQGSTVPPLTSDQLAGLRSILLRTYRPSYVIVGPMTGEPAAVRLMTELTGRAPRAVGGVELWKLR